MILSSVFILCKQMLHYAYVNADSGSFLIFEHYI